MYCSFYGIREKPFSITPDPRFLYLGKTHKEAFAHLLYGIRERGGFIVVTGEIGTGKTTLCRALLSHLDQDTLVAFIFNPTLSALELLKSINEDFGIPSRGTTKKELIDELNRFLLEMKKGGKNTVLIIDEAQNLDGEVLEQIRLLSNLETETEKLLQIILIGQPEFRKILEHPRLLQLNQRVTVRYHLHALAPEETIEYIHHRLSVIDGKDKILFSTGALKKICSYTRGVPRLINVLCDRALLGGYGMRRNKIDSKMIDQAYKEVSGRTAWRKSFRFLRLFRQGLVPGAVLVVILILLGVGLGGLIRKDQRGPIESLFQKYAARSEGGFVLSSTDPDPSAASRAARLTPTTPDLLDAVASESSSYEHAEVLGRTFSSPDEIEILSPSLGQEAMDGKDAGFAREGGESQGPETLGLSGSSAEGLAQGLPSYEDRDGASDQEVLKDRFLRSFRTMPLLETREEAFLAVVEQWGHPISDEGRRQLYRSAPDLYKAANALGFRCLRVRGNINRVRALNLPTLLELRLGEDLSKRYAALLAFQGPHGEIAPALSDGSSVVPLSLLESCWYGTAYVLWRDVWGGEKMLIEGMRGETVGRVQSSLQALGYYQQEPSGTFDRKTMEAVRAFQRDHFLEEDGILGPQTKIVLYQALNSFQMPRLEGVSE